jgi:hypothetical protein
MSINDSVSSAESLNQISERLDALEKELKSIRERNLRVEASKAWETILKCFYFSPQELKDAKWRKCKNIISVLSNTKTNSVAQV